MLKCKKASKREMWVSFVFRAVKALCSGLHNNTASKPTGTQWVSLGYFPSHLICNTCLINSFMGPCSNVISCSLPSLRNALLKNIFCGTFVFRKCCMDIHWETRIDQALQLPLQIDWPVFQYCPTTNFGLASFFFFFSHACSPLLFSSGLGFRWHNQKKRWKSFKYCRLLETSWASSKCTREASQPKPDANLNCESPRGYVDTFLVSCFWVGKMTINWRQFSRQWKDHYSFAFGNIWWTIVEFLIWCKILGTELRKIWEAKWSKFIPS